MPSYASMTSSYIIDSLGFLTMGKMIKVVTGLQMIREKNIVGEQYVV